jgi:thymidylate synthase
MADGDTLSLAAVYRSHDYVLKALGNFIGLSRLLNYVCSKTGHSVGTLTCLSAYAFLGTRRGAAATLLKL